MNKLTRQKYETRLLAELEGLAIRRLADRRIDRATYSSESKWRAAILQECIWIASLYEANHVMVDMSTREMAELIRDGLPPMNLIAWVREGVEALEANTYEKIEDAFDHMVKELEAL